MIRDDVTHFHGTRVGFDVYHVANNDLFLEDCLIDGGVKPQLLGSLYCFQPDDDVRNGLAVPAERVLRLGWR